jgi:uncharacterized protein YceK
MTLCLLALTGCSTLMVRDPGSDCERRNLPRMLYPATQGDFRSIRFIATETFSEHPLSAIMWSTVCIIDVPFSLISDTIFLPHDLVEIRREKHSAEEKQGHQTKDRSNNTPDGIRQPADGSSKPSV